VKDGKASVIPELCIDCGSCLRVCPTGAIQATTRSFADLDKFRYKVAVPSPVLFGQFPMAISPAHIVAGLHCIGFDAVWDFSAELALANRALLEYVDRWKGPYPLISVYCPVIVRLVQVLYPDMVDQLIRVQLPRELAARELKRKYSEELGIDQGEIAAVYITPCQAKTISILAPAEGGKSSLDGAVGISDIYNDLLAHAQAMDEEETKKLLEGRMRSGELLRWSISGRQRRDLSRHGYMSVTGLPNVIQVLDDIEKGKLSNVEFVECHACWGGCIGGNLAVDNVYVTRGKVRRLMSQLPDHDTTLEEQVDRRYPKEDFTLKGDVKPRTVGISTAGLKDRIKRKKTEEAMIKALPGLDCGLCGAPTCETFAKDVAMGQAQKTECVFLSDKQLERLRKIYPCGEREAPEDGS